ncbi:PTCB-BRCT domain protein [Ceratobasidium sp. AG-Ba]|nr:PTCB-BRCT domain protein [Ceratobasidium sp. AG-Ba]QRW04267.1 PTCB-BRCT domain protein [Ceratobasidium sp. AG-Ba]
MSRRGHGSTKVPNVKIKPIRKGGKNPIDDGVGMYDAHATNGTARDALKDDKRPFLGLQICCTGVKDKPSLFSKARELGAICSNDFTDLTTHLVADAPGSAKYECAVKLGVPVLTSDWILDAHTKWLAGMDIDLEECIGEHLLPPLKGIVICTTRLTNDDDRQRITKSAVRLGAAYQAHLNKSVTHLLIGPDDGSNVDSQKLQWVKRMNEKRRLEPSEGPIIYVVWDSWLLHCAVAGSRVSEDEFCFTEDGERPDPPEDIERWLKKSSSRKPAKVYVTASSIGAGGSGVPVGSGGKEMLEKARVRKIGQAGAVWNSILSASQNPRDPDSFVPPTQMQQAQPPSTPPRDTSPPLPVSSAPPPALNLDDSATEDEEESVPNKASSSRAAGAKSSVMAAPDPPTPVIQATVPRNVAQLGTGKTTSMVSRLNSLRGSAFQFGPTEQSAPASGSRTLARMASARQEESTTDAEMAPPPLPATASPKVFAGKRIAPVGEARKAVMLYAALRTHGAIIVGEPDDSDPKGKGKAKEEVSNMDLPEGEVDYYIVRLSGEAARRARELDFYEKFRTDCWVEHCIFEGRICRPEENITYAPLKIQLPVLGAQFVWDALQVFDYLS